MTALALALLAACPESAQFERAEQQEAACALLERRANTVTDRATLARLLAEPEFAGARRRNANFLLVLWDRFVAWFNALLETAGAAHFAKAVPFVVLTAAFSVALLVLLRFVRPRGKQTRSSGDPAAAPLELRPAPEHLADARRLLASAPREAIREALLALLSSLERRQLARPDRVKTNRELCDELPKRGADAALTTKVRERVDWYDRAFYSLEPVSTDQARTFVDGVEKLVGA